MNFVTDRTAMDTAAQNEKGTYGCADLNRVEENTGALALAIREQGFLLPEMSSKTDWHLTEIFSAEEWPTAQQMERYLGNVRTVCQYYGLDAALPETMEHLTWEGANQIEQALQSLKRYIDNTQQGAPLCGVPRCGG